MSFVGNFLEPISYIFYFIALIIYGRKNKSINIFLLRLYYALMSLWILLTALQAKFRFFGQGNVWMYNAAAVCSIGFVGYYFYQVLDSPNKKRTIIILVALYFLYAFIKNFILKETWLFDSVGYCLMSAFITAIVFMYFHQVLKNVNEQNILRQFDFWLASGYLIYYIGSFIVFLSYYYLTTQILATYTAEERYLMTALWGVHNVLLFISALSLLTGSLWLTYRSKSH